MLIFLHVTAAQSVVCVISLFESRFADIVNYTLETMRYSPYDAICMCYVLNDVNIQLVDDKLILVISGCIFV